ncbi:MAG: ABC transporter ATP-binding protein [Armatimonadota bacterium]
MKRAHSSTEKKKSRNNWRLIRRTLPMLREHRWRFVIAGIFTAFSASTVPMMPMFTRYVIDNAIPKKNIRLAIYVMAFFVVLMLLRIITYYIAQSLLLFVREKLIFDLRKLVFTRMQELCLRFHQRYTPGYLYDRTLGATSTSVGIFLNAFFQIVVNSGASMVISILFCWHLSRLMTLVALSMSIIYVFISKHYGAIIWSISREFNVESNELAGRLTDLLRGIKTIKAFTMEGWVIEEFEERTWPLQMRSLDVNKTTLRLGLSVESITYFVTAIITVMCTQLVIQHTITLGTMVAFIAYQAMLTGCVAALSNTAATYGSAAAGLEQLFDVIDEKSSVAIKPDTTMPDKLDGRLSLDDVHFAYDDKPIIDGLSIDFEPGQSVAIVGPSGGGKSTLINLLLRLYDPEKGCIRLDGRDIRDLPLSDYRSLFGVVLQDPFLFNDTIYNNLLAVKPDATHTEIREALERAHAWEFVSNLDGNWSFNVGENGGQLSGGQRQRIAIARCILTNPRMLVFDEATSALDNQSEALVQSEIEEIMHDRTVFIVAHRLSTVRRVDRILVLEDGKLVQDGTYDQLAKEPGLFHDLDALSLR